MKAIYVAGLFLTLGAAAVAIEAYYKHPTYGRGMKALIAVADAALAFGPSGA